MNRQELVARLAEQTGMTKADCDRALAAVIDSVKEALARGEKVSLVGFGTFEVRTRAPRQGRNPQTREVIQIPGGKVPAFRPGAELKAAVAE